jgi:hypothetical protein
MNSSRLCPQSLQPRPAGACQVLREPALARCETQVPQVNRRTRQEEFLQGSRPKCALPFERKFLDASRTSEVLVESAHQRAAADEWHPEADALFFAKIRRLQFERKSPSLAELPASDRKTTPRTPSYAPAFGTVSRCEPISRRGRSASCRDTLHANFQRHRRAPGMPSGSIQPRFLDDTRAWAAKETFGACCARLRKRSPASAAGNRFFRALVISVICTGSSSRNASRRVTQASRMTFAAAQPRTTSATRTSQA